MSSDHVARAVAAPRLLRTAVFTAVCVLLSATGHVLAACAPVPWWTLVLGFLGVFAVVAPLAGRARSTPAIVAALTGGQLALHSLFGFGQQHMVMPTGSGTNDALIRMAAKLVCGAGPVSLSPVDAQRIVADAGISLTGHGGTGTTGTAAGHGAHGMVMGVGPMASADGLLPSLPMVLGHLLAALVTGWLLRHGDLALHRLVRLSARGIGEVRENAQLRSLRAALSLVRALRAGLPGTPIPGPRGPRASYGPPPVAAGETLQHTVIRRGPPAGLALAA
ncbi:hypothetical protein ACIO1C_04445 [Streptomyces sp. NPDC087420]|uniref:hypothetical protein n=1 Tax=Streptomyces sp. NPDC087420 TaxID=3365785 RepID=UPI003836BDB8